MSNNDRSHPAPSWAPGPWDALGAVLAVGLSLSVLANAGGGPDYRVAGPTAYLLTGVGSAMLAWGRQMPLTAMAIASAATATVGIQDHHVDVLPFVVSALLFESACYLSQHRAVVALAIPCAAIVLTATAGATDLSKSSLFQSLSIFVVVWILGRFTKSRRESLLALVEAGKQQAIAERDRATLAQVEERLAIARELHDVLAHSISVISVQATVGAHLSASDPAAARTSLETIGKLSRTAMGEVRQMLALLRDQTGSDGASNTYTPAPGLADIDDLLATYRTAGLQISMKTTGQSRPISSSAGLCGYRIVQEALTNTLRHSGAKAADVTLAYGQEMWSIAISDQGTHATQVGHSGHGLIGMRERTSLLGGHLEAGPAASGGYLVKASIPYEAS